ncbi:Cytolysin/lectin [Glomus cerebriforme]|uniref:Cytolysin/lectin n=1 Tax=Glomus cerebriforme TaxID=658196 RepID=A0A397SQ91_9GLOM|nr:Cytolysin/lectin [Glomus cerebriforme]
MSVGIYEIPNIVDSLLEALLKELQTGRKIAITIKNYSQLQLEKPKLYYVSGTSQFGLPSPPVLSGLGLVWGARKTEYSAKGTAGVIVYHIKDSNLSLAFMWCVPFAYVFYENWWNVKIYEGLIEPNEDLFMKMYYDSPHEGNGNPFSGKLSNGLNFEGSMGNAGQCTIDISIKDKN